MEDFVAIVERIAPPAGVKDSRPECDNATAYFAVFDGHGGAEAAAFARAELLGELTRRKDFWSDEDVVVVKAIKESFISTHLKMWTVHGILNLCQFYK